MARPSTPSDSSVPGVDMANVSTSSASPVSIRVLSNEGSNPFGLPHPRSRALSAGSASEDTVRRYVGNRMHVINRRYVKRFSPPMPDDDVRGYRSLDELCADLDDLVNILWQSGTPSLQVPHLLSIASEFETWLGGFEPAPRPTLVLLRKLDYCFASLLEGRDLYLQRALPGFERGLRAGFSRTDMVRCQSTAQLTRNTVSAKLMGVTNGLGGSWQTIDFASVPPADEPSSSPGVAYQDDLSGNSDGEDDDEHDDDVLQMAIARIYERTLVKLGEQLGGPPVGAPDFPSLGQEP